MSDAVSTINLLSNLVCDISIKDIPQISQQDFEDQKNKILYYEKEIQIAIFTQAVLLLSHQQFDDIISSYSRVLSHLENCLIEALPVLSQATGEDSFAVSLSNHTLSAVQRLRLFIDARFLYTMQGTPDPDKPLSREKLKLNISVPVIATLLSAFVRSAENVAAKEETAVMRFMIQLFSSKKTDDIAFKSFQNNYRTPERAARDEAIAILTKMIRWLREL